jgi:hypothetical protein
MSKLSALKNVAAHYNPSQPRDENGRWTDVGNKVRTIAQNAVEKGIVVGAGMAGHHVGGEVGAVAAMLGARAAVSLGKRAFASATQKQTSQEADNVMDEIEKLSMGDVFGHAVSKAVGEVVGEATGIPLAGTAAGIATSAIVTPQLVKAAQRLKGKMNQQQTTLQPKPA